MDLGVVAFVTQYSLPVVELARELEARGFESLFVTEHTHIPTSRETPYAGGKELPEEYRQTYDPFAALAAAAAVTERLRLGTGICLVPEHDPIVLAKQVATVDRLSDGRFLFGVGAGWNAEEMRNHGVDPATRWAVTNDRIAAMQAIWSNDEAEYHGRHVDFDPIWSWPKPVQQPWPPVLVGGAGERAFDRVIAIGDGWMPLYGTIRGRVPELVSTLGERCDAAGRPRLPVTVYWASARPEALDELSGAGVSRALLRVPTGGRDVVCRRWTPTPTCCPTSGPDEVCGEPLLRVHLRERAPIGPIEYHS